MTEQNQAIIEVNGLCKSFGDFTAVKNLDMRIYPGKVHGFLGPNGSGKTTAIRMMCGLLSKSAGSVHVLGLDIDEAADTIRDQVGYMTQRFSLYEDMTVRENLNFIAEIRGLHKPQRLARIECLLVEYKLESFQHRLAGPLSGGQKRRLALATALITEPKLLILDEPTSEVDPNTRREMWQTLFQLAAKGTTILVSTHLMDEAERCHHLTILNEGCKVADGETEQLKQDFAHSVLKVTGDDVASLTLKLKHHQGIISVAQSGLLLRVIVDQCIQDPIRYVKSLISENYHLEHSTVSIEDIFVSCTDQTDKLSHHE